MHPTPAVAARIAPLFLVIVLAAALAACGSQGAGDADVGDQLEGGGGVPAASAVAEPGSGAGSGGEAPPLAAPIEQRIVKTGEVTLEVENVGEALGRVRAMAVELGGYVGGSQAGTLDDRATLTIRIPAATFEDALARLHGMDAKVLSEATREQDVTTQVVDLGARIDNLTASEASYRELVARAERVEDILAVQSRLDQVRGEIEQLQAQLDALEGQASLSTLTITLVPAATPVATTTAAWDPGGQLDRALASLVGIGQGLLDGLIWFAVVWLPVLLILAVIGLVALRGVLEVRRRMPSGAPAVGDDRAA
jgi:Domain of unknown function (DUF4349)